jgi:hypothetical protein
MDNNIYSVFLQNFLQKAVYALNKTKDIARLTVQIYKELKGG